MQQTNSFRALKRHTKTDNRSLAPKLQLRRHFLNRYHQTPPRVFDACQGQGVIWTRLRSEYTLASYWGVDTKPGKGRLKIDSERILAQPGWRFDVIDIDTYGSPWSHWTALLPHVTRPVTVFLTMGKLNAGTPVDHRAMESLGMTPAFLSALHKHCPSLKWGLGDMVVNRCLALTYSHGLTIVEAARTVSASSLGGSRAYYFGVRLEPEK
jgi:hypothetical protein